ncbi:MAG: hypothetical protein LBT46_10945 [Planctomycetaceae bacterium]|jgi:hypothetical protein|nr:hypothetical protein [Planctomycetaceae bacterium]
MLTLSPLPKTWLLDVDGTIVRHNGYLFGGDTLLDGVKDFFAKIPPEDTIVLLTARTESDRKNLETFLSANAVRYDVIVCGLPVGERILINDRKPGGLPTAHAVNKERDAKLNTQWKIDENL